MVAAAIALFSTNAMAEEESGDSSSTEKRVSANGTYEFQLSWGVGLQYGLTFTDMANWNDYLLIPAKMNYFDVDIVADHEIYAEVTPVEGFRISVFGGYQSLYISNTGFNYGYAGVEPAFSVRRSFYEFAVGLGIGYGKSWLDNDNGDIDGHGLLVRPFVEARFYPCDIFALYLRIAFSYYKEFGIDGVDDLTDYAKGRLDTENNFNADKLSYAGPNLAIGVRFGDYKTPVKVVPDSDGDGVLDDIDDCVDESGSEEFNGCPNPDPDGDGMCDPWVAEKDLAESFAKVCKGTDKCSDEAEDVDGYKDDDGCADPDNDGDGICDAWVSEKGLSDKYASICKGADKCADESEDVDGFKDDDGCADPDNDGDGICDPWVSEKGLSDKYASVCKGKDLCPNVASSSNAFQGCVNPDADEDGFCDAWVYENNLQGNFPQCKGKDMCPNEKGDDAKGCIKRRVEVTADKIEINEAINFASGKATIQKSSDSLLEEIANVFKNNPQIKKVEIQGHTDLSGNAKSNQKLSENRAKAVYDRLVKLGVEKDRMISKGYGMSQPVEPLAKGQKKETAEQAAKNRRVVFLILEQDEVKSTMTIGEAKDAGFARDEVKVLTKEESKEAAKKEATPEGQNAKKAVTEAKKAADNAKKTADDAAKKAADKAAADKKAAEAAAKKAADKAAADKKAAEAAAKKAADKAAADKKAAEEAAKKAADQASKKVAEQKAKDQAAAAAAKAAAEAAAKAAGK